MHTTTSSCWCQNPVVGHRHANAYAWYEANVPPSQPHNEHPKQAAWYHLATLFYKLGITILY